MECSFAHIADYATTDARGKYILVGIFDLLFFPRGARVGIPRAFIVAQFRASVLEGSRHLVELRLTDADGKNVMNPQALAVELQPEVAGVSLAAGVTVQIGPLPLPGPGEYAVRFFEGAHQLREIPIHVVEVDPPASA